MFGEVADAYQRARPTYPTALFDTIVAITDARPGDPVFEIGAGTGKATEGFLTKALRVTACEPSPGMANVLRSRFPEIVVHESSLEDAAIEDGSYVVVAAAQSWHWVDPVLGPARAADALRDRGWLALFWNRSDLDDSDWHDELQPIYERITPHMTHAKNADKIGRTVERAVVQLGRSRRFGPCTVEELPWVARYTTSQYIDLLGTYSDHRILPDDRRAALHGAIAESLDARGGTIDHPFVAELLAAPLR